MFFIFPDVIFEKGQLQDLFSGLKNHFQNLPQDSKAMDLGNKIYIANKKIIKSYALR